MSSDEESVGEQSVQCPRPPDQLSASECPSPPSTSSSSPTPPSSPRTYLKHSNVPSCQPKHPSPCSFTSTCLTLYFILLISFITCAECLVDSSAESQPVQRTGRRATNRWENVITRVELIDDHNLRLQLALPTRSIGLTLRATRTNHQPVHTFYRSSQHHSNLVHMNRTIHRERYLGLHQLLTTSTSTNQSMQHLQGHVDGHQGTATIILDQNGHVSGIVTSDELGGQIVVEPSTAARCRWQRDQGNVFTTCAHSVHILKQKQHQHGPRRVRRSYSVERTIEVLMVTDLSMQRFHGEGLRNYVLTLMAIVSHIFEHSSVGNEINIKVVRIDSLVDEEQERRLFGLAQNTLRRFCSWQHRYNFENDQHALYHDTAMLLTRRDLCRSDWRTQEHRGNGDTTTTERSTERQQQQRTTCDTLGLAHSGQICDPQNSCAIVEDNGLSAAFTIAHELGHLLGIPHDDEEKCKDYYKSKEGQHELLKLNATESSQSNVMARMIDYNSYMWSWSPCSRHFLNEYLDSGYGNCLLDGNEPNTSLQQLQLEQQEQQGGHGQRRSFDVANLYTNNTLSNNDYQRFVPAGEYYNAHRQCELVFGKGSSLCPDMPLCTRLWCKIPGEQGCRTQSMPWADGTYCKRNHWCQMGKCVDKQPITAVHGRWGEWSPYSKCSLPCGGGIRRSQRECDNPPPANGGRYCLGERVKYQSCNLEACHREPNATTPDLREQQCSAYNNQSFGISSVPANVTWVPHYAGVQAEDVCKLYCADSSSGRYFPLKPRVIDGTPCTPDSYDLCVNGRCMAAGCDRILGSGKTTDSCGVCGGDNSTCYEVSSYYRPESIRHGYNYVVMIPPGATNVEIRKERSEKTADNQSADNWLAMRADDFSYLLNGRYTVNVYERKWHYGGTVIQYTGASQNGYERLNTSRPLERALHIEVLCVGELHPPLVFYRYTMHNASSSASSMASTTTPAPIVHYEWALFNWTECDRACQGHQERQLICRTIATNQRRHHQQQQMVPNKYCQHLAEPVRSVRECHKHCHLDWVVKPMSEEQCSAKCGAGWRKRLVYCEQRILSHARTQFPRVKHIDDSFCAHLGPKPAESEPCNGTNCVVVHEWYYGEWNACQLPPNVPCGRGRQLRAASCRRLTYDVEIVELTNRSDKVIAEESTSLDACRQQLAPPEIETNCQVDCSLEFAGAESRRRSNSVLYTSLAPKLNEVPKSMSVWESGDWSSCQSIYVQIGQIARQMLSQFNVPECFASIEEIDHFREKHAMLFKFNDTLAKSSYETLKEFNLDEKIMYRRRLVACVNEDDIRELRYDCNPESRPIDSDWCPLVDDGRQLVNMPTFSAKLCPPSLVPTTTTTTTAATPVTPTQSITLTDKYNEEISWHISAWTSECRCHTKTQTFARLRVVKCVRTLTDVVIGVHFQKVIPDLYCLQQQLQANSNKVKPEEISECTPTELEVQHDKHTVCAEKMNKVKANEVTVVSTTTTTTTTPPTTSEPIWPYWSDWSECKVDGECGNGSQKRVPICPEVRQRQCPPKDRLPPTQHRSCQKLCDVFRWQVITDWSACSTRCGLGVRHRRIVCLDFTGTKVPDKYCNKTQMPAKEEACQSSEDCRLVWRTGPWSECNQRCGAGLEKRVVTCHRVNSFSALDPRPVPQPKVLRRKKRKEKKKKKKKKGEKRKWKPKSDDSWQGVDVLDGSTNSRPARALSEDAREHQWCNVKTKPADRRVCSRGACPRVPDVDAFVWTTTQWESCSTSCGDGYQERRVYCHSLLTGEKVPRSTCEPKLKPYRRRHCKLRECHVISCRDLRDRARTLQDGDYEIWVQGAMIRVYCHGMYNRETPLEYLQIAPQVYADNYAQLIEKSRDCAMSSNDAQVSVIYFRNVRLNITSLELIADDTIFSVLNDPGRTNSNAALVRRANLTYGQAAFEGCPQMKTQQQCQFDRKSSRAMFSINLHGTGLIVTPQIGGRWTRTAPDGLNIDRHVKRSRNGEKVIGYCGLRSEHDHQVRWTTDTVAGTCRLGCQPVDNRIQLEVP